MKRESASYPHQAKKATEEDIDSFFANLLCTSATDTAALLASVTEDLTRLLLPALVTVWDHNATAGCLVLQHSNPPRLGSNSAHTIPTTTSMTGLAVQTTQPVLIPSLEETIEGRQFENPEVRGKLGLRWMYCIPVLARHRPGVAAVINLYYCKGQPTPPLTDAQCRRLSSILGLLISLTIFHEQAAIRNAVNHAAVVATGVSGLIREVYPKISERCHCTALDLYLLNQADGRVEKELEIGGELKEDLRKCESDTANVPNVSLFFSACIERAESVAIAEELKGDDSSSRIAIQCMAMGAPLITRTGRPFGFLRCFSPDPSRRYRPSFSSLDLLRLETFLQSLSPAIERFTRTRAEQTLLKAFSELTRSSGKRVAISGFLEEALGALVGSMHAEVGSVYLRDPGSDILRMKAAYGPGRKLVGKAEYRLGEGITGWIAQSGEMVVLNSKAALKRHHAYQGRYDEEIWGNEGKFRNFIGVPIESSKKRVGVLKISNRGSTSHHPEDYFTDEDREHLAVFSSFIGYGLERERMLSGFRALAETSVESLTAEDEDDAISTILGGLEEVGFRHVALDLCREGSLQLQRYIGTGVWEEQALDPHAGVSEENPWEIALKSGNYAVLSADGLHLGQDVQSVIIVPLLSQIEKLGTIAVGAEDEVPLEPGAILLVRAFGAHLAVAIAAARHRRKLLEHTEAVMASSRFIVAEALSGFALHSLHHKVSDLLERLENRLRDPRIREREEVRTALEDVKNELAEFELNAEGILDIVRSPEDQSGSVDVNAALQKVIDQWYSLITSKRSRVEVLREASHTRADIPRYAFHEIISVLVVNAIQAHSSLIRIRSWDAPEITLPDGTTMTNVVCIDVRDNGQGIVVEPRDRIFDADFTTKPKKFGTGLGLFIARRLANESGGELYVIERAKQAKGTTFRLVLQQSEEEEEEDGRSD